MHHHPHEPIQPNTRELIHHTIQLRAYALWEERGRPEGEALDHWLEAEREFLAGRRPRSASPIPTGERALGAGR